MVTKAELEVDFNKHKGNIENYQNLIKQEEIELIKIQGKYEVLNQIELETVVKEAPNTVLKETIKKLRKADKE